MIPSILKYNDIKIRPLFVHIPKTGGRTIKRIVKLHGNYKIAHNTLSDLEANRKNDLWYWRSDKFGIDSKYIFKFTFTRNPWDRLVSAYHYWHDIAQKNTHKPTHRYVTLIYPTIKKYDTFSKFVYAFYENQDYYKTSDGIFRNQCNWLDPRLDYIGKYENFDNDLRFVCDILDVKFRELILNPSNHTHYTNYYSLELKQLVNEIYTKDITELEYEYK